MKLWRKKKDFLITSELIEEITKAATWDELVRLANIVKQKDDLILQAVCGLILTIKKNELLLTDISERLTQLEQKMGT